MRTPSKLPASAAADQTFTSGLTQMALAALLLAAGSVQAIGVDWRGKIDVRAVDSDTDQSWTDAGLGKSRYDRDSSRFSLGQAVLRGDLDLLDTVNGAVVLSASDQHHGVVDIQEARLGWNPLPSGAWKMRVKGGYFFPPTSVEVEYGGIDWTPARTISSSAINSWIGEELRTNGLEWTLWHSGRYEGSPHDYGVTAALFNGNDSTGTLLAWRGWSISDRIAGRNEAVQLADLPIYRPDGAIPRQTRTIHPFREIDGRLGYYVGANYSYRDGIEVAGLHYDNRADPLAVKDGQYAWRTKFDHVSLAAHPGGDWEWLFQAMRGNTYMGRHSTGLDYQAWYALVSHPLWAGKLALRYDRFSTTEHDIFPSDPNSERGRALALAYSIDLSSSVSLITELLAIQSNRPARSLIGQLPEQTERSITTSLRWEF